MYYYSSTLLNPKDRVEVRVAPLVISVYEIIKLLEPEEDGIYEVKEVAIKRLKVKEKGGK